MYINIVKIVNFLRLENFRYVKKQNNATLSNMESWARDAYDADRWRTQVAARTRLYRDFSIFCVKKGGDHL